MNEFDLVPGSMTPEQVAQWLESLPESATFTQRARGEIYEMMGNRRENACYAGCSSLSGTHPARAAGQIRIHQVDLVAQKLAG